ncbi:MAG: 4-hydroxyphenylpyruvate dioxygenase [Bacteroidia bacterium]
MDTTSQITPQTAQNSTEDFLPLLGTDYVEFYVGNAKQASYYYQSAWGYELIAYAGPETGVRNKVSYVLRQGKIRLVLTASLDPDSDISNHVKNHGDGVKVLALWVDDAEKSLEETLKRGAKMARPLEIHKDEHGEVRTASIHTYGETIHTFVERKNYKGTFMPGYEPASSKMEVKPVGLQYVDHCVGNVGWGEMNTWVKFYEEVLGFRVIISFDDQDISTEYSALMSKVVANSNEFIKFPINEPAEGKKKSQVEEYLDFYHSAGVQHLAVATDNIMETVAELRRRGVDFLEVPGSYYDDLLDRVGEIQEDINEIRKLNILVDRDDQGYLLQLFTKPVEDRPTLFYEIIQRRGARAFGKGNFKALFEAIEREQERRGTL